MLTVILKLKLVCNLCTSMQDDDVMEITHKMLRHKTDLHANIRADLVHILAVGCGA